MSRTASLNVNNSGSGTEWHVASHVGQPNKDLWVQVGPASFDATVGIDASIDGSNWVRVNTVIDAGAFVQVPAAEHLRVTIDEYTSGTITATVLLTDQPSTQVPQS
jgi:hypothetical protein